MAKPKPLCDKDCNHCFEKKSQKLDQFRDLADKLREQRRLPPGERSLPHERDMLDQLSDMFDGMNDDEQEVAAGEGWRGWPDLYDAKEKKMKNSSSGGKAVH